MFLRFCDNLNWFHQISLNIGITFKYMTVLNNVDKYHKLKYGYILSNSNKI